MRRACSWVKKGIVNNVKRRTARVNGQDFFVNLISDQTFETAGEMMKFTPCPLVLHNLDVNNGV